MPTGLIESRFRAMLLAGAALLSPAMAMATPPPQVHFEQSADDMADALREVSRRSGTAVMFSADRVAGLSAPALHADLTAEEAVRRLVAGSGLRVELSNGTILIRGRAHPPLSADADAADAQGGIVVTGTRIRGAVAVSPVTEASRDSIEKAGFSDLGTYVRSLPQNYSGGQNPGVAGGGDQGSQNVTSSSTINLRGLGPDATLTLLNGHRVAYDGANQGVDVAAIPLAAVDRIEIVPDGSSALYGSDAVGGVANVILRRDFQGLETSARVGAATDGGDVQQQYDAVAGRRWTSGGFMLAGDYNQSTAINASQRSFSSSLNGSDTLVPRQRQYSFVLAGHQDLTDRLTFSIDGQYSHRTSFIGFAFSPEATYLVDGSEVRPNVRSLSVTPTMDWRLPGDWKLTLTGTHAESTSQPDGCVFAGGEASTCEADRYHDVLDTEEAGMEGALFRLPGGDARLAFGAGHRDIGLDTRYVVTADGETTAPTDYYAKRDVLFGYGELSLPFVGGSNGMPLLRRLQLSSAIRYERYRGIGGVATPKFGVVYSPFSDVTLKSSWGRSFKAPTLDQEYQIKQAILLPSFYFGSNEPAGKNTILIAGGNRELSPEKAQTWTVTASYEPSSIRGLRLEASYFHVRYRQRVVEPLKSVIGSLDNPSYRDLIIQSPSLAQIAAALEGTPEGLRNETGADYDPASVDAIIDDSLQNTASQIIHGIDLAAAYMMSTGGRGTLDLNGSASYLTGREKLSADQPSLQMAGTLFSPPHWRARAGAVWANDAVSLSVYANYIGTTLDNRFAPHVTDRGLTTVDLSATLLPARIRGPLRGFELLLSCLNVGNAKPSQIRTTNPYDPTYDSTNYSAVGRSVSLTVSRKW